MKGTIDNGRFASHRIVWEGAVGHARIVFRSDQRLHERIRVYVEFFVFHQAVEPLDGLLRMPSQRVAIDAETGVSSGIYILADWGKVHFTFVVNARGHFHSVAGNGLVEVRVGQGVNEFLLDVFAGRGSNTQLEVWVFGTVNVVLQRLVAVQVGILCQAGGLVNRIVLVELVSTGSKEPPSDSPEGEC